MEQKKQMGVKDSDTPPEPQRSREREELVDLLHEQYEWWKQDGCSVDEYVNGTADILLAAGWRRK